jgi:mono/diheme cytochrome c family protein
MSVGSQSERSETSCPMHRKYGAGNACRVRQIVLLLGVFALVSDSVLGQETHVLDAKTRAFVQRNCIDCHGPDEQEAGLRIDRLSVSLDSNDTAGTWEKVLNKVSSGKMPPPTEEQPAKKAIHAFTSGLSQTLHNASLARQRREGRVVLRRLNRNDYETTLRDLLGPQVEVKDLLPEDRTAAGFDNVSDALDISAVHLLRYQQAAERAVRSAIPNHQPNKIKVRLTGRQITEKVKTFKSYLDKSVRLDGDKLVMHVRTYDSVPCASERVKQPGRYRVRASLSTVGTGGRALPIMVFHGGYRTAAKLAEQRVHDIPAQGTTVITEEFDLESREIVVLNGWDLPSSRELLKRDDVSPLKDYPGDGLVVDWIEIEGPIEPFPSSGYRRLFGDLPLKRKVAYNPLSLECTPENPREDARQLIQSMLPVAFRRPVAPSLVKYFTGVAHDQLDQDKSFQEAMIVAYTAMFCSPHFLYLTETLNVDQPNDRTQLDQYAVASRLSYFLWSSLPDKELFQLAAIGKLREASVLHAQVERMLKDPKSERFKENFAGQWLDLRNINATTPDPRVYGEFDDFLYWSIQRETRRFFDEILSHDRPLTEFVDSDWGFLNQRLAQHYGIAGVAGGQLRRVTLPKDSHRGGVLTQAAIMKVTADGSRTSPVLRGKWILERIVGLPPDPPPPNTPAIDPDVRGTTTIREQLDKHRNIAACAACHNHIDPPGFALESFDAIGGWREFYRGTGRNRIELANYPGRIVSRGPDVEASGQTADGRAFRNIEEYKQILLRDKDQLARNLATKLIIYSTGADIQFSDREVIEQLVAKSRADGYGFRSLLHDVVQSRLFLYK